MIFELKDIEVKPPELCVECRTIYDIPTDIWELGVAVCNDDKSVWVKGEYAGKLIRVSHDVEEVIDYARNVRRIETLVTVVSVGRSV